MTLVAVIDFERAVEHIDVQIALVEPEEGGNALHVADDAVGVGRTLHQHHAGAQQDGELAVHAACIFVEGFGR